MKLPNPTAEEVERRHAALPEDALRIYESADTSRALFDIGRRNGLTVDTIGSLAEALGYLILGFLPAKDFPAAIADMIGDAGKANAIAAEINQKILAPIRYSLERATASVQAKPIMSSPSHPDVLPGQSKKPEPLIIRPLGRVPTPAELEAAKREERGNEQRAAPQQSPPAPTPPVVPGVSPVATQIPKHGVSPAAPAPTTVSTSPLSPSAEPAQMPASPQPHAAGSQTQKQAAAPVMDPRRSIPPTPPMPSPEYLKARRNMEQELVIWKEKQARGTPAQPSPQKQPPVPALTKNDLERELARAKQAQNASVQKPASSGQEPRPRQETTPTQPKPAPVSPSASTPPPSGPAVPSPQQSNAPDPYREPIE